MSRRRYKNGSVDSGLAGWLRNRRAPASSSRGQSLVEFALILPVLILIIYGVFDLGRAFYAVITVANASREGARYMTRHVVVMDLSVNNSLNLVRSQIKQEASGGGLTLVDALITINCVRDPLDNKMCMNNQDAWVRVEYDFRPLFAAIFPTTIRVGWETRMQTP